jgi:hypothetical protein
MNRMNPSKDVSRDEVTGVDERRRSERLEADAGITVQVDSTRFGGRTRNISQAGVFFFSGDRLRVTVAIEQGGETVVHGGHLVRVERMNEDTTGFAIEFDHP